MLGTVLGAEEAPVSRTTRSLPWPAPGWPTRGQPQVKRKLQPSVRGSSGTRHLGAQPGAVGVGQGWLPGEVSSTLRNERCLGIGQREEQCEVSEVCKTLNFWGEANRRRLTFQAHSTG